MAQATDAAAPDHARPPAPHPPSWPRPRLGHQRPVTKASWGRRAQGRLYIGRVLKHNLGLHRNPSPKPNPSPDSNHTSEPRALGAGPALCYSLPFYTLLDGVSTAPVAERGAECLCPRGRSGQKNPGQPGRSGALRRVPQCGGGWRRGPWPDNTLSGRGGPATPAAPATHTGDCQTGQVPDWPHVHL